MSTIYSLRTDPNLAHVQSASLGAGDIGLKRTHGLVGSNEWWANIESGSLPLHTASGTVSQFWPGHHGDWPEFELLEPSGASSRWGCRLTSAAAALQFTVGRHVEVDYVGQSLKAPWKGSTKTTVVVAIRVEPNPSIERTATGKPVPAAHVER